MSEQTTLDYQSPQPRQGYPFAFFGIYIAFAVLSLAIVSPMIDQFVSGHRGDQVVSIFCIASVVITGAFAAVMYWSRWFRRLSKTAELILAGILGLGSVLPAYVVLFLCF